MTTISSPPSCPLLCRNDSRMSRLILFRTTAFSETFFEIASPRRALCKPLCEYRTKKKGPGSLFELPKTAAKSDPLSSLSCLLKRPDTQASDLLDSGAQTGSATCTACIDNGTAAACTHSGTEPMTTLTLDNARLKSSLHDPGCLCWRLAKAVSASSIRVRKKVGKFTCRNQECQHLYSPAWHVVLHKNLILFVQSIRSLHTRPGLQIYRAYLSRKIFIMLWITFNCLVTLDTLSLLVGRVCNKTPASRNIII